MEYNKNDLYKNGLNYGLILGLAFVVFTMIMVSFKIFNNNYSLLANVAFTAVAVYFGNVALRDKMQGGYLSYARSLGSGTFIGLVAGVLLAIFIYIFYSMISPESLQEMYQIAEQQMLEQGIPEDQLDMAMSMTKKFMTPGFMAFSTVFNLVFCSFLVSLVVSAVVKRKPEDEF